ncbi:MAG: ATP/GTP-binding protein [Candidatus Thermoplasmatota archaeon]|jgi:hypothetical protein|nr:ATP/GTP-binding protein [Candidatus Thermoplasmatota archaeon]MDP7266479.1 ATP/GTP-binding protein [Candidatus Thermoplasmatota archaeon]
MIKKIFVYFVGTAGSGKTTLVNSFGEWLVREGAEILRINLDPGADSLPYVPDIDIREWVNLYDIMEKYNLGPNGAQIASADRIAMEAAKIKEIVDETRADYVLVDSPGQIELFAFRNSSRVMIEQLDMDLSLMVFLVDPFLSMMPSGYISQQLLYITCQLRFPIPSINVLSKCDIIEKEKKDMIIEWANDSNALYSAALDETVSVGGQFNLEILRSIRDMDLSSVLYPCSSETREGMADIYNIIQQAYSGGDDIGD